MEESERELPLLLPGQPLPHHSLARHEHSKAETSHHRDVTLVRIGCGKGVLHEPIGAISVGLLGDHPMLDLCYTEDRDAEVDLNVVGTPAGGVVEVQGTAEGAPIRREKLDRMIDLALGAMPALVAEQKRALSALDIDIERLLP